jgi:hypothetical protein
MNFVGQFNQKADLLLERLRTLANGRILINLFAEFNHATLDAVNFFFLWLKKRITYS